MLKKWSFKKFNVWIACLAILLNALAPSASHAMSNAKGNSSSQNGYAEICSVGGTKIVAIGKKLDTQAKGGTEKFPSMSHCAFCLTHDTGVALPTYHLELSASLECSRLTPSLFYTSATHQFSWAARLSRAPPNVP